MKEHISSALIKILDWVVITHFDNKLVEYCQICFPYDLDFS